MGQKVYAAFGGWTYLSDYPTKGTLDRHELFELKDQPNDHLLLGMRYVMPYNPSEHKTFQCPVCGRKFIDQPSLHAHRAKPDCFSDQKGMSKADVARVLDQDPSKVSIKDMEQPPFSVDEHTEKV